MASGRGHRTRRVLVVLVAGLLAVGLAVGGVRFVRQRLAIREIDRHERVWMRERPSAYRYEFETVCHCAGQLEFDVTVVDGRVVSIDPEPKEFEGAEAIEDLFDIAREAIRGGAHSVEVEYAGDGHPTRVSIDQIEMSVDDEVTYLVRDLRPVPPDP